MKALHLVMLFAIFLFGSGIAGAATFDPVSLDFGSVPGTITDPMTIAFTNDGTGPIELTDAFLSNVANDIGIDQLLIQAK